MSCSLGHVQGLELCLHISDFREYCRISEGWIAWTGAGETWVLTVPAQRASVRGNERRGQENGQGRGQDGEI